MSQIFLKDAIPREELLAPGHAACPGCGGGIALRLVLKALGPRTIVAGPAYCWSVLSGPGSRSALGVPHVRVAPEGTAAAAAGIRAALDARRERGTTVLAWANAEATLDLGLQALSGAVERNDDLLFVCCDGGAALDARIQGPGTPRPHPRKDLVGILAAHRIPYAATGTVAHAGDLMEKVRKARGIRGTRFLHVLAPCPPEWQVADHETVDLARQAVRTRAFPLFEVENGQRWRLTADHPGDPVEPYVRRQGRFRHLTREQVRHIQSEVDARWETLKRRVEHGT